MISGGFEPHLYASIHFQFQCLICFAIYTCATQIFIWSNVEDLSKVVLDNMSSWLGDSLSEELEVKVMAVLTESV